MKKLIIFSLIFGIINFVEAQVVKIPDINFKNYLLSNGDINTNGDKEIQVSEAQSFTGIIDCSNRKIKNLIGIEEFINIVKLDCSFNLLVNLDLSKIVGLRGLFCYRNKLVKLDISKNAVLNDLRCDFNQLTNLDVSKNIDLNFLMFRENKLTKLDISKNKNIRVLSCNSNRLTDLDVSQNEELSDFDSQNNPNLKDIKVNENAFLKYNRYWKKDDNVNYISENGKIIIEQYRESTHQEQIKR